MATAPPIVNDVLRAPGHPLDAGVRAAMESRFGHDFSRVRVHTDHQAAESVRAVDAQAYAFGQHVVFSSGLYAPHTSAGRWLLSHELAHVVQHSQHGAAGEPLRIGPGADDSEREADRAADAVDAGARPRLNAASAPPVVARKVVGTKVSCTTGTHQASADPVGDLATAESRAQGLAQAAAILAQVGSAASTMDIDLTTSSVGRAYQARFGLPPAVRGGFRNRLTGRVVRTRNDAVSGELEMLSARLQRIANTFDRDIHYRCIGGPTTAMGCSCDCTDADACACAGIRAIFLCPGFWGLGTSGMATLLVHEAAHMLWENVRHAGNYRNASCYANFVADILNAPLTGPDCPTPP